MSDDVFTALVARVGVFHLTDRAMKNAQTKAEEAMRAGTIDEQARAAYLDAVRRYFAPFEREARGHLRDIDRRLEHANQVVFNLMAERGVAVKRIEATQSVLAQLSDLEQNA